MAFSKTDEKSRIVITTQQAAQQFSSHHVAGFGKLYKDHTEMELTFPFNHFIPSYADYLSCISMIKYSDFALRLIFPEKL